MKNFQKSNEVITNQNSFNKTNQELEDFNNLNSFEIYREESNSYNFNENVHNPRKFGNLIDRLKFDKHMNLKKNNQSENKIKENKDETDGKSNYDLNHYYNFSDNSVNYFNTNTQNNDLNFKNNQENPNHNSNEMEKPHSDNDEKEEIKIKKFFNKLDQFINNFERWQFNLVFAKYLNIDHELISYDLVKNFEEDLRSDKILVRDLSLDLNEFYPKLKTYRKAKEGLIKVSISNLKGKTVFLNKILSLRTMFEGVVKEDLFIDNFIFFEPLAKYIKENINSHIRNVQISKKVLNFTQPEMFFPLARKMKRKFIYHLGPTNSGKTSNALERLAQASTGIYLAPLRLLAWEIHEKLIKRDVRCTLLTGQDRIYTHNETHYSMTIEKCDFRKNFEVAVIDEIQMIEDEERGSAWTNAVLGLQADEIHLCGDERGLFLLKQLCDNTGDEIFFKKYNRFSNLIVEEKTFEYRDLRMGDCIIAFSKMKIMEIKKKIVEAKNGDIDACAVIYGDLPAETKKDQAKMFNELTFSFSHNEEIKYDYLVASDAVLSLF